MAAENDNLSMSLRAALDAVARPELKSQERKMMMRREVTDEDLQLLEQVKAAQQLRESQATRLAKPLPWFRGRKFILVVMILFIIFGAIPGLVMLLLMWTGRVARPFTSKSQPDPLLKRKDKAVWSFLVFGGMILHLFTVGM